MSFVNGNDCELVYSLLSIDEMKFAINICTSILVVYSLICAIKLDMKCISIDLGLCVSRIVSNVIQLILNEKDCTCSMSLMCAHV
jgi:hypothetical protein